MWIMGNLTKDVFVFVTLAISLTFVLGLIGIWWVMDDEDEPE